MQSLAVKYRPKTFNDVVGQDTIKIILQQQLENGEWKHAYLFCGGAGTGKTSCARILANEINGGEGTPIELDAASHNGVDDVRNIIQQAKSKSIESEYKCFIIDECVTGDTEILTRQGWKRIDSITESDDVAQYTEDGKVEFVENWEYVKKEYSGDMYDVSFRNGKRHVLMSPHHVQPVRMCKSGKLRESYIQDCKFTQSNEIIVAGKGTGNNKLLSSLDRLYIACQADGYCNKNYKRTFWELSLKLPEKIARVQEYLNDCGIEYKVYKNSSTSIRFYQDFPSDKKLSSYFELDMGVDRARDFISEILLWDGSTKSGYPGHYCCTDKDNVDFVSAVLTLCGYSGTVNVHTDSNPLHNDVWSVNWYYQDCRTGQAVSKERVEGFEGTIYCVKVPSNMIVLRAEGFAFISGNCHSISSAGWQAFLKIIEEPPAKSVFIFATTDPQKIPKTILSRVQRYDFQRISQQGIFDRLCYIGEQEEIWDNSDDFNDAAPGLSYIARLADGGLRDAITLMDKCLAYSNQLTLENVVKALGTVDYDVMIRLTDALVREPSIPEVVEIIESIHSEGKDIKQFVRSYLEFLLDVNKQIVGCPWEYLRLPKLDEYEKWIKSVYTEGVWRLLDTIVRLNYKIKYSQSPKYDVEAELMLFVGNEWGEQEVADTL